MKLFSKCFYSVNLNYKTTEVAWGCRIGVLVFEPKCRMTIPSMREVRVASENILEIGGGRKAEFAAINLLIL